MVHQSKGKGMNPSRGTQHDDGVDSLSAAMSGIELGQRAGSFKYELSLKNKDNVSVPVRGYLPLRPARSQQQRTFPLLANYFDLSAVRNWKLYRYTINDVFRIDQNGAKWPAKGAKLSAVILEFIKSHESAKSKPALFSDLKSNIYTKTQLPMKTSNEYSVEYSDDKVKKGDKDRSTYTVILSKVQVLSFAELYAALDPNTSCYPAEKGDMIAALNILVGYHIQCQKDLWLVNNSRVFSEKDWRVQGKSKTLSLDLQGLRGFFFSVRPAAKGLLMNVNVSHAAFWRHHGRVSDVLTTRQNEAGKEFRGSEINGYLKGRYVETLHRTALHTICGIAKQAPPLIDRHKAGPAEVRFEFDPTTLGPGEQTSLPAGLVTVEQFFSDRHGLKSGRDFSLKNPVINIRSEQRPMWVPAELCSLLPGQHYKYLLKPAEMGQMTQIAIRKPGDNRHSIQIDGHAMLGLRTDTKVDTIIKATGFNVAPNLVTVEGRLLMPPMIQYRSSMGTERKTVSNGSWDLRHMGQNRPKFQQCPQRFPWDFVAVPDQGDHNVLRTHVKAFCNTVQKYGLELPNVETKGQLKVENDRRATVEAVLANFSRQRPKPAILLVILTSDEAKSNLYHHIKYLGDCIHGIQTVCMKANERGKFYPMINDPRSLANDQYCTNVALKINLKLGGRNHAVESRSLLQLKPAQTMIVGMDVTHPGGLKDENATSIASMVASKDGLLQIWPAIVKHNRVGGQELIDHLEEMMVSRLQVWHSTNGGKLPDRIIIYRDGVSEGQYGLVLQSELPKLEAACAKIYRNGKVPPISLVIVGKRHHTRFFPADTTDRSVVDTKTGNPKGGTVVDSGITEPRLWDFYLQSHTAIKGTAKPAHYVVLHDQIFRETAKAINQNAADLLQDFTNALCYTFGRTTRPVSICAPAYYADMACTRARLHEKAWVESHPNANFPQNQLDRDAIITPNGTVVNTMYYI